MDHVNSGPTQWILLERRIDAPRAMVWNAWTRPDEVRRWWGPQGFTAPFASMDLRVGGRYIFCMRDPGGKDYWSAGTYKEIEEPERLVCTDSFSDDKGHIVPASTYGMKGEWPDELLVTLTLTELQGGTRMRIRHEGFPPGDNAVGAANGWNTSIDKMVDHLLRDQGKRSVRPQDDALIVVNEHEVMTTTIVDATPDEVWRAYSDPTVIVNWWGPRSLRTEIESLDLKVGGKYRFINIDARGNRYYFHGEFKEIMPGRRIVLTFEYEGTPGHVMEEEVRLEPMGERTRVVTKDTFATAEDRDGMLSSGMEESTFEILERLGEAVRLAKRN